MISSAVLDVALGMMFCYGSIALIASYLYETGASLLKLRAKSLLDGIKDLLGDPELKGLALDIYKHAMVNPRQAGLDGTLHARALPSYIPSRSFAIALIDTIQGVPGDVASLRGKIDQAAINPRLKRLLVDMVDHAQGDAEKLTGELSRWFDAGMDRVSGVYKRLSQLWTFFIGLGLAVLFNIDTFRLFDVLWRRPALASQVTSEVPATAAEAAAKLVELPLGWGAGHELTVLTCLGWIVTASTVIFGAPFWFDLLKKLSNIRGAGRSPVEKK
jgi:hypothetical protein